uniref:hypothetical protein n=1 Tax=Cronobacter dublinensis TaxID=413497 RepID=UPI001319C6DB
VNNCLTDFRNGVQYNLFVRDDLSTYINFMYRGVPFENKVFTGGVSGFIDIFKGNAEYWLTLDRKKGRVDRKKELRALIEDIVQDNSECIYNESESKSAASLLFYAKYGLIFDNQWKNYQICGKSIEEYLEGDSEILLASEETVGFYNEFKEKYIYSCNLAIQYLASVAKREGISCELSYRFDDEFKGNSHSSKVKIYSLTLKNDGLSNRNINFNVIKSELRHPQVTIKRRYIIPCYDNKFLPISLPFDKRPDWVFSVSDFNIWVDSFIFLRCQDNDIDEDLDLIFNYYSQHQSENVSRQDFKDLYMKCWREIGIV